MSETITPDSINTSHKTFYAIKTDKYNHLGNSAGQDDLGQIITALISFKRLQKELGPNYQGWIILIDELEIHTPGLDFMYLNSKHPHQVNKQEDITSDMLLSIADISC